MKKIFIVTHLKITNRIGYLIFAFLFVAVQPAITFLLFQTANWFLFVYKYVNGEFFITGAIYMVILLYSIINIGQLINEYKSKEIKEITDPVQNEKEKAFDINNVIKRKSYSLLNEAVRNPTLEKDEKKELNKEINEELNITLQETKEKIAEIILLHQSKLKIVDISILEKLNLDDVYSGNQEKSTLIEKPVNEIEKNIFEQAKQVGEEYSLTEVRKEIEKEKIDMSAMEEDKEGKQPEIEPKEKEKKRQNKLKNYPKDTEEEKE